MPTLEISGKGSCTVPTGKRLVNAIAEQGVEIGHRCGGQAKCTTCRVSFEEGEPDTYTKTEYEKLNQVNSLGDFRLSCQITVDHDMKVKPLMLAEDMGWDDTGPEPADEIEPDPTRIKPKVDSESL